jgi:hypothetical protein
MLLAPLLAAAALERISFWSDRAGDPDVFTTSVDGSDVRNLGTRNWGDKRASWSPDGEQIAYDSWYVGHREFDIWVMDADGGNKRQLTKSPLLDVLPAAASATSTSSSSHRQGPAADIGEGRRHRGLVVARRPEDRLRLDTHRESRRLRDERRRVRRAQHQSKSRGRLGRHVALKEPPTLGRCMNVGGGPTTRRI